MEASRFGLKKGRCQLWVNFSSWHLNPLGQLYPCEPTSRSTKAISEKCPTEVTQPMQQQEKTARRRLVVLFAERDFESIQPAAVTKRNVVTERANVPCEYRTSPLRRHASSIGAIGSRPHALCSRAS